MQDQTNTALGARSEESGATQCIWKLAVALVQQLHITLSLTFVIPAVSRYPPATRCSGGYDTLNIALSIKDFRGMKENIRLWHRLDRLSYF